MNISSGYFTPCKPFGPTTIWFLILSNRKLYSVCKIVGDHGISTEMETLEQLKPCTVTLKPADIARVEKRLNFNNVTMRYWVFHKTSHMFFSSIALIVSKCTCC